MSYEDQACVQGKANIYFMLSCRNISCASFARVFFLTMRYLLFTDSCIWLCLSGCKIVYFMPFLNTVVSQKENVLFIEILAAVSVFQCTTFTTNHLLWLWHIFFFIKNKTIKCHFLIKRAEGFYFAFLLVKVLKSLN